VVVEVFRCEVPTCLLKLNHERYGEEVTQGLHDERKGKRKSSKKKKAYPGQPELL
jgi:hypothetical protein